MAAAKVVPNRARPFVWVNGGSWRRVRLPLESESGAQNGEIVLVASVEEVERWVFKVLYRTEEVYRLDVREAGNHPNPANSPENFPKKVPEMVHEHVYCEGLGMKCARPLPSQIVGLHVDMFETFCDRARIECEPVYQAPPLVVPRLAPQ